MTTSPFNEDRTDKNNPLYTFTPPAHYTPQEVEAGQKLVEIINSSDLTNEQKKESCWQILNNVKP